MTNKLETKLQALIKEKDKWEKALDEVDTELMRTKSNGSNSQPFQDACSGILGCEIEIEKIKARMMQHKKYSNITFPKSWIIHVTDFPSHE
jgi:hypothetical protein